MQDAWWPHEAERERRETESLKNCVNLRNLGIVLSNAERSIKGSRKRR